MWLPSSLIRHYYELQLAKGPIVHQLSPFYNGLLVLSPNSPLQVINYMYKQMSLTLKKLKKKKSLDLGDYCGMFYILYMKLQPLTSFHPSYRSYKTLDVLQRKQVRN